ncbi:MAG: alkaline phosphatase family protein [Aquabacterium sp.]|uniref:alkaline phosphatase family protein n=1 Tax=Aquabacterium sp. TaxID=1872578 RepID=UPI0025C0E480|nr:alkaline phosphatase family protein [Aquabacterium sp.]MBI3383409.1 alkaline phosphatase family protein [Aquabacterium sp.]
MKKSALSLAVMATVALSGVAHSADTLKPVASSVLLISVDGLHQNDLDWFVKNHPNSALARMVHDGVNFKSARTPFPSDSFPGMVGLVTGGNPRTTGVYYDDAYSRKLLPAGTTDCAHAALGAEVQYAENVDKNPDRLDAGQNIPGLYNNFDLISRLSAHPAKDLIDLAQLPVDPKTCSPVFPHQYIKVNTVFEVLHANGLHTAWSDKHAAYDILNGPSGVGIDDLFTPEINGSVTDPSLPGGAGADFTKDNLNTQRYDSLKVKAVLNWIQGHDHAGNGKPGTPALFGLNFQSVSTAQKLNVSSYLDNKTSTVIAGGLAGYVIDANGKTVPGPVLEGALTFVDQQIGQLLNAADLNKTVFIVTAKHGQSPQAREELTIINDGAMIDALNAAWASKSGAAATPLVAHAMDDDGVLLWLNDRSEAAAQFAGDFLARYAGTGIGSDAQGNKLAKSFTNAGLKKILIGHEAAEFIGVNTHDDRVPDLIGIAKQGSVYGGAKLSKIAEHGGDAAEDRHVGLVVYGKGIHAAEVNAPVETTRVAPTILKLLGLPVDKLQAVRIEGTRALPGVAD